LICTNEGFAVDVIVSCTKLGCFAEFAMPLCRPLDALQPDANAPPSELELQRLSRVGSLRRMFDDEGQLEVPSVTAAAPEQQTEPGAP